MPTQAEANLRALIETTEDSVWSVDLDYRLLSFNKAFQRKCERNFGVRPKAGMSPWDFPPEGRGEIWPPLYDRAFTEGPYRIAFTTFDKRTLELSFNPFVIDGKVAGVSVFGKDITERIAAEESRQLLAKIVESSLDAIVAVAPNGAIMTWNRGAEVIFGYSEKEAIGLPIPNFIAAEMRATHAEKMDRLLLGTTLPLQECTCERKDGREILVSYAAWPIFNSTGQVTAVCFLARDITLRREAEGASALLASIVESSDDAVHALTLDGTVASWNRGAEALFGYTSQEIVGKNISILVPPGHEEESREILKAIADGFTVSPFDTLVRRKDGTDVDVSLSISPIRNSGGTVVGASAIARDITDRKRADQARQEAEQKYRDIVDGALEGIFQNTLEGESLTANPALARMLGYDSPDEVTSDVKDSAHDVWVDPNERARFLEQLEEHGAVRGFECRFKRKDGSILWVSLNSRKGYAADGRAIHQGFCEDITDRKLADRAIQEAEMKYRDIFDGALEGVFQTTLDGKSLTANPALARMLGYDSPEEVVSSVRNSAYDVWLDPNERSRFIKLLEEQGSVRGYECQYKRKDGAVIWVSLSSRIVRRPDGQTIHQGFIEDITDRKRSEMQLRDSEEQYRKTFEQASIGIVHVDFEGRILRCNTHFAEILGYAVEEVCSMTFQEFTVPDDLPKSVAMLQELTDGSSGTPTWEKRYKRKDGSLIWVKLSSSTQRDGDGRPMHIITFVQDINARKEGEFLLATAANALLASETRYRSFFQMSLDAIHINRLNDGTYFEVNQAFLDITGYEREEVIGHSSLELCIWANPRDRRYLVEAMRKNPHFRDFRTQFRKKNGQTFWGLMSASLIELEGVACILAVTRDISEAVAAEDEIRNLAFYDSLTSLPNRRLLLDRLQQALAACIRNPHKQALLFVDLDNFKTWNDTLGHQTGDLLLKEVALRLTACVREADTVARIGGDEFVVMLEDLSETSEDAAAQAKNIAEKISAAISHPFLLGGRELHNTSSIGITVFGAQPESASEILQQAEIAMFQSKAAGRNTMLFFAPALQAAVNSRAAMEDDLRRAIRENQFVMYYQPQLDTTRLIGAEALVRWNHPTRGLLYPGEFIPLAEETGLILPLGNWVLETTCEQIAAWADRAETSQIALAVNISARQFRQPDFVNQVWAALARTGANPQNLKLELTESMLVENIEDVITKMTELKMRGLRFSIDDFGTGYSSLAYLKRLPLDQLKIDRSFVRDILEDAASGAIAQAIISLGRAMGLSVIAEGVETEEQRGFLTGLGCHTFQGYLFARALPLEEFQAKWPNYRRNTSAVTK